MKKNIEYIRKLFFGKQRGLFYIGGSDVLPPPLSKDEESRILEEYAKGSKDARNILIERNLRLVVYIAKKFESAAGNVEDLISIGTIGLIKAINTFKIDKNIKSTLGITCDVKTALTQLLEKLPKQNRSDWWARTDEIRQYEKDNSAEPVGEFTPFEIVNSVKKFADSDTPVATDVGQHQMWVAQGYRFDKTRTFISSGGLGTMGFGMGAAIGAAIATKKRSVLFTGDGSFGMNLNELATAVSHNVPMVIVVMNNKVLGMVRQWQTMFFDKHYSNTNLDSRKTDFVKLAAVNAFLYML